MPTTHAESTRLALEAEAAVPVPCFEPSTLHGLPQPAQRLLKAALADGTPLVGRVDLEMSGRIKLGVWLPFTAQQLLVAGRGFVWEPVVGGRIVRFVGADSLDSDGARMVFHLHGRIPVVNATGADIDRSAAGRLAAETVVWLPQALTPQAGATWRPIDDDRATVVLDGPGGPVEVDVTVDSAGALVELCLQRWNGSAKPPRPEPFGGVVTALHEIDGVRIAGAGAVGWQWGTPDQDDGVFFRYTITGARFGAP